MFKILKLFILIFPLIFTFCKPDKNIYVEKGVLNLQKSKQLVVSLKGNWEFYWNKVLFAHQIQEIQEKNYCFVFHNWIPCSKEGQGYATYYLKILIPDEWIGQWIAIYMPTAGTSYNLYINDELYTQVGKFSTKKEFQIPNYGSRFISWKATTKEQHIIIHVSNFFHKSGGLWYNIEFGLKDHLERNVFYKFFLGSNIAGILILFGLYHLGIYLQRLYFEFFTDKINPRINLYFSLLCFAMAIRSLLTGEYIFYNFLDNQNQLWIFLVKLEYISTAVVAFSFYKFISLIFPDFPRKEYFNLIINFFVLSLILFTIFSEPILFTQNVSIYFFYGILSIFISFVILLYNFNKNKIVKEILGVLVIGLIFTINDYLYARNLIDTFFLLPYGIIILILISSISISKILDIFYKNILESFPKDKVKYDKSYFPKSIQNLFPQLEFFEDQMKVELTSLYIIVVDKNPHFIRNNDFSTQILLEISHEIQTLGGVLESYNNEILEISLPYNFTDIQALFVKVKQSIKNTIPDFFESMEFIFFIDKKYITIKIQEKNNKYSLEIEKNSQEETYHQIINFLKKVSRYDQQIYISATDSFIKSLNTKNNRMIYQIENQKETKTIFELFLEEDKNLTHKIATRNFLQQIIVSYYRKDYSTSLRIIREIYYKSEPDLLILFYMNQIIHQLFLTFFHTKERIKFSLAYRTNFKFIDFQHSLLIYIFENLQYYLDNIEYYQFYDFLKLFELFKDFIFVHFATEEFCLRINQYSDLENHIKEHNYYKKELENYFNFLQESTSNYHHKKRKYQNIVQVKEYLHKWFIEHLLLTDIEGYGKEIKNKNFLEDWIYFDIHQTEY